MSSATPTDRSRPILDLSSPPFIATPPQPLGAVEDARHLARRLFDIAPDLDASGDLRLGALAALRESGLLMAPWPDAFGGQDLVAPARHAALFDVLRLIGWGDLAVGRIYEGHVNAVALLCRYGTPRQRRRHAEAVADGELMGVWAADDATGLRAEAHGAGWRLRGRKILASGAGLVTSPIVTARTEAGPIMLLPHLSPDERTDLGAWTPQGMRASATGSVDLSDLDLAGEQRLGDPGDFLRQPHFSGGAWRCCAVHLGAIERLLDLFRAHLTSRKRDTDPYQIQRIAHAAAAAATGGFWIRDAARRLADPAEDPDTIVAFVNLTRMVCERAALDVMEAVQRGVGLQAFLRPNPIERVARDLATYLRQPVPDLAMADAAKAILASPRTSGDLWRVAHED